MGAGETPAPVSTTARTPVPTPASTTTTPPHTTTAVSAIFETTTTPDRFDRPADTRHVTIPAAPEQVQTEAEPATTERYHLEELEAETVDQSEEEEKEKEEPETSREDAERYQVSDTGEQRGMQETQRERLDWATDTNTSIGPVPSVSEFRPNTPPQSDRTLPAPSSSIPADPALVIPKSEPIPAAFMDPSADAPIGYPGMITTAHAPANPDCTSAPATPVHSVHASTTPVDPD